MVKLEQDLELIDRCNNEEQVRLMPCRRHVRRLGPGYIGRLTTSLVLEAINKSGGWPWAG